MVEFINVHFYLCLKSSFSSSNLFASFGLKKKEKKRKERKNEYQWFNSAVFEQTNSEPSALKEQAVCLLSLLGFFCWLQQDHEVQFSLEFKSKAASAA